MNKPRIVYAPWREEFVLSKKKENGCIFCNCIAIPEDDAKNYVVYRGDTALVMLNLYPYTSGHLLVIPYRHVADLEDINDAEHLECAQLMQQSVGVLKTSMSPDGYTLGLNIGRAAGAGVPGHLHWHVVCRWSGDSNFLPVIGGSRLLSVSMDETFSRIAERWTKGS